MIETWRNVTTHNGAFASRYQVSNLGRVRAHESCSIKGSKPGRILFQGTDNKGYKHVCLYGIRERKWRGTTVKVHRLVTEAFIGPKEPGLTVNHKSGDKTDNSLANLEYISNQANARHGVLVVRKRGVEIFGYTMTLTEAIERFAGKGVTRHRAFARIHRLGWCVEDAVTLPVQPAGRPTDAVTAARRERALQWA